jgi:hypothetical protein
MLDGAGLRGTSTAPSWEDQVLHSCMDTKGSRRMGKGSSHVDRGAPVGGAPGSSFAPQCGCGGDFVKNKVVRILADAPGVILPRMKHSFVDRQYSPSTGMDRSEWEIILEELILMGFLVKQAYTYGIPCKARASERR